MSAIPMDADLVERLGRLLSGIQELSGETGIVVSFGYTGPAYLETDQNDILPVRLTRTNGSYVVEEPLN